MDPQHDTKRSGGNPVKNIKLKETIEFKSQGSHGNGGLYLVETNSCQD
jgi:hypothetical protein